MKTSLPIPLFASIAVLWAGCYAPSFADPGDPVAIRRLPKGDYAIESMWNLSVVVASDSVPERSELQGVDLLFATEKAESNEPRRRFLEHVRPQGKAGIDHLLDRPANLPQATFVPRVDVSKPTGNAIRVRTFPRSSVVIVDVDGVRVTYAQDPSSRIDTDTMDAISGCDVLIVAAGTADAGAAIERLGKQVAPRFLLLATDSSNRTDVNNTLAIRSSLSSDTKSRRTIVLNREPTELPVQLASLMQKKEAACEASQKVFATLSVKQLNFRPSNGTHTPRWNAEHMMGRELLFFSQIFAKQDPAIPVMDLNPKQMPPDYVARHADWTGEEEARQMERSFGFHEAVRLPDQRPSVGQQGTRQQLDACRSAAPNGTPLQRAHRQREEKIRTRRLASSVATRYCNNQSIAVESISGEPQRTTCEGACAAA